MLLLLLQGGAEQPPAITGTAALGASSATIAASGAESFGGTGALGAQSGTLAGSGQEVFSGAGALTSPAALLAASGAQVFGGAAALEAQRGRVNGGGSLGFGGAGVLDASPFDLDAEGEERFTGDASVAPPAGELAGVGTVGDPPSSDIVGTAAIDVSPAELDAAGEYTPLAITGTADLTAAPGEAFGTDAEPSAPESTSVAGGAYTTVQRPRRTSVTVREEVDQPVRDVAPPPIDLSDIEALSSGSTGERSSREADTLTPEPAGSAELQDFTIRTNDETPIAATEEVITSATSGLAAEDAAAAPAPADRDVAPITAEEINALLAEREGELEARHARELAALREHLEMAEAFAVIMALVAADV